MKLYLQYRSYACHATHLVGCPELLDGVALEQGLNQPDNYGRTDKVGFNI